MPQTKPTAFDRDLISTMRSALELAVSHVDKAHLTPATKAKMAERIVRSAADGIRDPERLMEVAIAEGQDPAP